MDKKLNAHCLFDKCELKVESWWTALFTISAAHLALTQLSLEFKLYRYYRSSSMEGLKDAGESLPVKGLSLAKSRVECSLKDAIGSPLESSTFRPDIVYFDPAVKTATLIENKTRLEGGNPRKLASYAAAATELKASGFDARFVLLISQGHPNNLIWDQALGRDLLILRWEDVLRVMDGIGWLRAMFDYDLKPYYDVELLHQPFQGTEPLRTRS